MTTKYLDSKRISGTTADREGIPAVAGGWKELGRTTLSNTPTEDIDFTEYADQSSADTAWVRNDTVNNYQRVNISTHKLDIDLKEDNTNDAIVYDLGAGVSTTAWTMRFKIRFDTLTVSTNNVSMFTLSSENQSVGSNTAQDWMGLQMEYRSTNKKYGLFSYDNAGWGGDDVRVTYTFLEDTDYYVEIKRLTATTFSANIFTNADYSTGSLGYITTSLTGTPANMRYFKVNQRENVSGSGVMAGTIDDFQFWNNSSSTGTGDTIDVSSLADKRYYMVLGNGINTGGVIDINQRFGSTTIDTGNNYARRQSINGGSDGASSPRSNIDSSIDGAVNHFMVSYIANKSDKEKLVQSSYTEGNATGAGYAPERSETVGKWSNTSNPIDIMRLYNTQAGDYATGSECVVLGWDESDTHTTNFWEELASVDSTGDQTASFTAKKYLWIQVYVKGTSGLNFRMGSTSIDTGSNYSYRNSSNGGADGTTASATGLWTNFTFDALPKFYNFFMINNTSNEKLIFGSAVGQSTAGAGTAPNRLELAGKWTNTSNQADRFQVLATSGSIGTNIIKVWGSD